MNALDGILHYVCLVRRQNSSVPTAVTTVAGPRFFAGWCCTCSPEMPLECAAVKNAAQKPDGQRRLAGMDDRAGGHRDRPTIVAAFTNKDFGFHQPSLVPAHSGQTNFSGQRCSRPAEGGTGGQRPARGQATSTRSGSGAVSV